MRSPTPTQHSDLLTLPMGCCCSKPKIHPDIEKRREAERALRSASVYAPSILALPDTPVKRFSFGETLKKNRHLPIFGGTSSEEEVPSPPTPVIDLSQESIKQTKVEKRRSVGVQSKVPKTRGFDFLPSSPSARGPDSTPSIVKQNKGTLSKRKKGQAHGHHHPSPHLQRRPYDYLLYKKIEKGGDDSGNENFHTGTDSELDQIMGNPPPRARHPPSRRRQPSRGRTLEKKIISIRGRNGSEEFYEQTYSKLNVSFEERKLSEPSRESIIERRKVKASDQRRWDSYLAQPKFRIAPIIRVSSSRQSLERIPKPRRRILKKHWLMSSQRNLPMLAIDSTKVDSKKSLRFGHEVKVIIPPPSKTKVDRKSSTQQEYRLAPSRNRKSKNSFSVKNSPSQRVTRGRKPDSQIRDDDDDEEEEDKASMLMSSRGRQLFTRNYVHDLLSVQDKS